MTITQMLLLCQRCAPPESYYITSAVKLASFLKDRQQQFMCSFTSQCAKLSETCQTLKQAKYTYALLYEMLFWYQSHAVNGRIISQHCDYSVSKRALNRFKMRYEGIFKLYGMFGSVVEEPYLVPASPGMMMMERADFCCIDSKLPGARSRDPTLHRYYLSHPSLHCAFKVRCSFFPGDGIMP